MAKGEGKRRGKGGRLLAVREPTIALCMIVRDEERFLDDCLEAVGPAVDEVVIVDTGSMDKTVEIARKHNARVFQVAWNHDFSEARNFSIGKATSDWILVLDADERIEASDLRKLRKTVKRAKKVDGIYLAVWNVGGEGPASTSAHYLVRLFRRKNEIRYQGRIHEVVRVPGATCFSNLRILHAGYALGEDRMEEKYSRDLEILLSMLRQDPANPVLNLYTGRTYFNLKRHAEALKCLKEAEARVELPPKDLSFYAYVLVMKAQVLSAMGRLEEAESAYRKGLHWMPDHLDLIYGLATLCWREERFTEAVLHYRKYLGVRSEVLQDPKRGYRQRVINSLGKAGEVCARLAEMFFQQGNCLGAIGEMKQALAFEPQSPRYSYRLGTLHATAGHFGEARRHFQQALCYEPSFQEARAALERIPVGPE
jgi:glycosyltransferase involved in cell wall biosynthesis